MSRTKISELITVDTILAYPLGINSEVSIYFPGESLIPDQFQFFSMTHRDSIFSCYTHNSSIKILADPLQLSSIDPQVIFKSLPLEICSKISASSEILIGVMDYIKEINEQIESAVHKLIKAITIDSNRTVECRITVATVNSLWRGLYKTMRLKKIGTKATYVLNKDMRFDLYEKINCKSCRELPTEAYLTECCSTLYCECCKKLMNNCYNCGNNMVRFVEERFYNRFLKDLDFLCKCRKNIKCEVIREHSYSCELTAFRCKSKNNCKFQGTQAEIVAHALNVHMDEVDGTLSEIRISGQGFMQECPGCTNYFSGKCSKCPDFENFEEILDRLKISK